ncbi:MAG: hypothetical protein BWK78_04870, partial [Thiotrichaceae bacterium IS1]
LEILDYTHQPNKDTPWVNSDTLIENLRQKLTTTEGWQRFEVQTQGHLILTNRAFSQKIDPNAKPYKGLHYFDNKPEDALFFKGREKLIDELLAKVTEKSFLAVLGASGNGKSSVVRAGVLYQLQQQTERWQIVNPFTPTANPLTALTNGLGTTEVLTFVQASTKVRVILTIDQFEEVFSLCQESQARETFFNTLLDAVEQATDKFCLIVVMRADFLDKCSNYPRLARYFQDHQHIVTRPTEDEIQQIIEEPAKQAGLLVEPRLVAEMITDFKDSLGGLPLLEFALTTLWEKGKADRLLRYADYQALGGIQGILEKKATETYEKTLTPAEQVVAKRIFLELTELGEGKPDTRRLVPQTDLLGLTTTPTSVEQVIAKLVTEHLIVTDKTAVMVVNIAHDALIEHWTMLRKWLDQSREDLKLQRQINEGAKAWKAGKKSLLVGVDLARAEEYLGTHWEKVPLSEDGVEFVKASMQVQRRQRRWKWAGVASLIVTTVGLAGYTYWYQYSSVWEHETYCNQFVKRYGLPQCVGELTTSQVQGRAVSYRLLRKGSKNPVYKVQAVRGLSGELASSPEAKTSALTSGATQGLSDSLTARHSVGTYFKAGNQWETAVVQKPVQWEFVMDANGQIVYEKAYNQAGKIVWGLVYSPPLEHQPAHAHYVGDDGYPRPQSKSAAEFVEFSYSERGDEAKVSYFDRAHQPQPGSDGVYVIKKKFDSQGLTIEEAYFDSTGQVAVLHKDGYHKVTSQFDARGNEIERAFFGTNGQPILHKDGYHQWTTQFDARGNEIETAYFGTDRQPILHKDGYHKGTSQSDARGNPIERAVFGTDRQPILNKDGIHKWTSQFDARGNEIERAFFGTNGQPILHKDGVHKWTAQFDARGNKIETAFFGTDGQPILHKYGYHKGTAQFDERSNAIERASFGTDGQPILNKDGYHQWTAQFDARGNQIETAVFGTDGQPILHKDGVHKWTTKFDARGNEIETAFFGTDGQPILHKDGNHKRTAQFDARGNEIETAFFGTDGQPILHKDGLHKRTSQFDARGNEIERAFFGTDGQPILHKEGYHKGTAQFDARGNQIETAFFGTDGQPILHQEGLHKWTFQFDARGNQIERAFFGTDGQPILLKDGYHKWTTQFDARGNEIETAFFGTDGQPILNKYGWHKRTTQFDARGNEIERAVFGTDGQPILSKKGFHKITRKYDERGNLIEEFYFDNLGNHLSKFEKYKNFQRQFIRDEDVPPGMRIVHTPFGDRLVPNKSQMPDRMRVIVVSIVLDSQGEKLGIKAGDVFTHYDGQPVIDVTSFTARRTAESSDSPPKELRVLRDGKELSFMVKPGKIGVELGDRVIPKE